MLPACEGQRHGIAPCTRPGTRPATPRPSAWLARPVAACSIRVQPAVCWRFKEKGACAKAAAGSQLTRYIIDDCDWFTHSMCVCVCVWLSSFTSFLPCFIFAFLCCSFNSTFFTFLLKQLTANKATTTIRQQIILNAQMLPLTASIRRLTQRMTDSGLWYVISQDAGRTYFRAKYSNVTASGNFMLHNYSLKNMIVTTNKVIKQFVNFWGKSVMNLNSYKM